MDNNTTIHLSGDGPAPQILDDLESMFPSFTPTPKDDITTIMYRSGQRSVVEYIKQLLEN